jgi:diguanylate cyclase (GGDEF)-like protein
VYIRPSKLLVPLAALLLTVGALAGVWLLGQRADSSRAAQVRIGLLALSVSDLQSAPFHADRRSGGSPAAARAEIRVDATAISQGLAAHVQAGVPLSLLAAGRADLRTIEPVVAIIYALAVRPGGLAAAGTRVPEVQGVMSARANALSVVLAKIARTDASRAARARTQASLGAAAAMLLLLAAFAFFYVRSGSARAAVERLAREKEALLGVSRVEARTDALTELGNRRALASALGAATNRPPGSPEMLLSMFDLDGFKQYNDTFGHVAGDALLHRLGSRLAASATAYSGSAYRMGGDEFCTLVPATPDIAEELLHAALTALQESGETWYVGCSHGAVWIPSEAATQSQALKLADERMYANKASRSSASRQASDVLLQVLTEQNVLLDDHVERVAESSGALAEALGESGYEVLRIRLAARLHDIGKTAIPAAILDKPGPLNEREWEFMRRHPAIGERIVLAAPALASTAAIIRSTHERIDGHGYPDGLAGQDIPLGSRIIAVCDAFDAMTSERPYRPAISVDAALEELRSNAGTQFDAAIVEQLCNTTSLLTTPPEMPRPRTNTVRGTASV